MPFGIANAPAIFQRAIDQVIAGIPNTAAYLDDILITGKIDEEHIQTLERVLSKLAEFGFTCNPAKCSFFQNEVTYLGFIIDKNGKRPDPKRVEAILKMPTPKNIKELEAFIGKVNYYGKFISNFSEKCKVLNKLRQADMTWHWNPECQTAFDNLLQDIATATTLVHYDPTLPLILATDASQYGIGAVILHRSSDGSERPIAHASKTLTAAEQKYSQIEKEAFSIIYGVKKFHQFLTGRTFELNTDHKPLLTIFNPVKPLPVATANRLQRWAITLMGYSYNIHYKSTHCHANADALSRLPVRDDDSVLDDDAMNINSIQAELESQWPLKATDIAAATDKDETLQLVRRFTFTKWPCSKIKNPKLLSYFSHRFLLSVVNGCILRDTQVIIPEQLRDRVLQMLHDTHLGTVKMKQLARSYCWWPNINKDIEKITRSCTIGSQLQPVPRQHFKSWEEPHHVWSRVHMDFLGPIWNSKWLIIIDAKSKFPIVADMGNNTCGKNLIHALEQVIDWFGPPQTLVTDNGPPFNSYELIQFYKKYGIDHITTAPYHPASNGIAERFVRSFKEGMIKEQKMGEKDKYTALRRILRNYRWTPHTTTGVSPANLMLQHSIRTEFDMMKPTKVCESIQDTKYAVGQLIWMLKHQLNKRPHWQPAIITKLIGSMLYEVQSSDGQCHKRHQNQLRHRFSSKNQSSDIDSLPDDLLKNNLPTEPIQSEPIQSEPETTSRYPRRNRRAPDRYQP
jgi:transposase InsO family protein